MNSKILKTSQKPKPDLRLVPKIPKEALVGQSTIDQFIRTLNRQNKGYRDLRKVFKTWGGVVVSIYKKDFTLTSQIMGRLSRDCLPIVDKKLQVVIELKERHELFLRLLFAYHYEEEGHPWKPSTEQHSLLYLDLGYGYYFDMVRGGIKSWKINEKVYTPDRFDVDLFAELNQLPQAVTATYHT